MSGSQHNKLKVMVLGDVLGLFLLFLVSTMSCFAQGAYNYTVETRVFSVAESVPLNLCTRSVKDKWGGLWLGTGHSLSRFKVNQFDHYTKQDLGFEDKDYLLTLTDSNQNIYYCLAHDRLQAGSLHYIDPNTGEKSNIPIARLIGINDSVGPNDIVISNERNRIFILNNRFGGVFELINRKVEKLFDFPGELTVQSVSWSASLERYYYLSEGKLWSYDPHSNEHSSIPFKERISSFVVNDDHLLILFLHDSKKLYVDKPCWFFPKSGKTIDFRQNGEKIALLANNNKGQWCLKVGNKLLFVEGLPSGQLDTNLVMSLDNIHPKVATSAIGGADYADQAYYIFFHRAVLMVQLSKNPFRRFAQGGIRDIYQAKDSSLIVAGYSGGVRISRLNTEHPNVTSLGGKEILTPYGISPYKGGEIILTAEAQGFRVIRADGKVDEWEFTNWAPGHSTQLTFFPFWGADDQLWTSTSRGLAVYDLEKNIVDRPSYPAMKRTEDCFFRWVGPGQQNGFFWLASDRGAFLLDSKNRVIVDSLLTDEVIPINAVIPMGEDSIWVVPHQGSPLLWKESTQEWDTLPLFHPEWQNNFHALIPDGFDYYWLPSDNGLFQYHTKTKKVRRYTIKDGLPDNEFNRASWEKLNNGHIALGGQYGLIVFDPADFVHMADTTQASIAQLKALSYQSNGVDITLEDSLLQVTPLEIKLPEDVSQLRLSYHSSSLLEVPLEYYFKTERNNEGKPWSRFERGELTLSDLGFGRKTIHLAAKKKESIVFDHELTIFLIIPVPWYFSWPGILLGLLLLTGLNYAFSQLRHMRIRQRNKKLQALVDKQTAIIVEEQKYIAAQNEELRKANSIKDRLFGIIGHELKTPLLGVMGVGQKISYLLNRHQFDEIPKVSNQLDQYATHTRNILDNLLIWGQSLTKENSEEGQINEVQFRDIYAELKTTFQEKLAAKDLQIYDEIPKGAHLDFEPHTLVVLLKNILDNAIKFSPQGGAIRVLFRPEGTDESWSIQVVDNGIGVPTKFIGDKNAKKPIPSRKGTSGEQGAGIGLYLSREIAAQNNCVITLAPNYPKGTIATLRPVAPDVIFPKGVTT